MSNNKDFTVKNNIAVGGTVDGRDLATDGTKLDGIEASADVTDTANVTDAGALMDSEVTNLTQVKAFSSADYATAAQGATADAALPKAGGALTGPVTTTSTFDGVDIATRDGVLTTTTATADAALPKAGGAMTGAITTNSTFDGRDVATDGTKLDGIDTGANLYVHPTTAGNKHIPTGGTVGQTLQNSASGTAVWADAVAGATEVIVVNASSITNTTLSANGTLSGSTNGRWGYISIQHTGTSNNVARNCTLTTNGSNSHLIVTGWGTNNANFNRPDSVIGSGTSTLSSANTGEENYITYRFKLDASANLVSSSSANILTDVQYINL